MVQYQPAWLDKRQKRLIQIRVKNKIVKGLERAAALGSKKLVTCLVSLPTFLFTYNIHTHTHKLKKMDQNSRYIFIQKRPFNTSFYFLTITARNNKEKKQTLQACRLFIIINIFCFFFVTITFRTVTLAIRPLSMVLLCTLIVFRRPIWCVDQVLKVPPAYIPRYRWHCLENTAGVLEMNTKSI